MFVQESGEERDLTDEEKMRAAEILITIVMTLMKTFMKDMTEQQFKNKQKTLEDKHLKATSTKDLNDISRLIDSII